MSLIFDIGFNNSLAAAFISERRVNYGMVWCR